jgi:hypothetical protein
MIKQQQQQKPTATYFIDKFVKKMKKKTKKKIQEKSIFIFILELSTIHKIYIILLRALVDKNFVFKKELRK